MTPLSRNGLGLDEVDRRTGFAIIGTVLTAFLAATVISALVVSVAAGIAGYRGGLVALSRSTHPPAWATVATLVGLWSGYIGGFLVARRLREDAGGSHLFVMKFRDAGYLLVGIALQLLVLVAYAPFHLHHLSAPTDKIFSGATGAGFVLLCLLTGVVVPIFEELFFRATLVPGLLGVLRVSSTRATAALVVVADGLLFGLAHGEWTQFIGLSFVGAVLAFLFLRSGRLAPSALTHIGFNLTALVSVIAHRVM